MPHVPAPQQLAPAERRGPCSGRAELRSQSQEAAPSSTRRTPRWTSAGQQRYGSYVERLLQAGATRAGLRGECPGTARALPNQARGRQACPQSLLRKKPCSEGTPASNLVRRATPLGHPESPSQRQQRGYPLPTMALVPASANLVSPALAQADGLPGQRSCKCGDPRLRIRCVTFTGLPDLLAALAGAPAPRRAETLGSGSGSGRVARALLAVFQRGRQIWSGAVLGVRPRACHVLRCPCTPSSRASQQT